MNNVVPLRIELDDIDDSEWYTGKSMIVDGGMTTFDAPIKGWMVMKMQLIQFH